MSDKWVWPYFMGGPADGREIKGEDTGRGWLVVHSLKDGDHWYWPVTITLNSSHYYKGRNEEASTLTGWMHADLDRDVGQAKLFEGLLSTSACVPLDRDRPDTKY